MNQQGKGSAETRASLELLYHISRELAADMDLRTVLNRVLFLSMKNVGAINGSIIVLGDNGQPVDSAMMIAGQRQQQSTQQLRVTFEHGLAGWVARERKAVLLPDTSQDERWLRRPDDADDRSGPKSAVAAPILARDMLVGVMTLVHPRPAFFSEDHLALVQAISDQAGIAILNARLYDDSQRQARVMTAIAESAAVITGSLDLDEVLQRILVQVGQALRVEVSAIALVDFAAKEVEYRAAYGENSQKLVGLRLPIGRGIAGWVAKSGRGVNVPYLEDDPRTSIQVEERLGIRIQAAACVPIRSRGQVIGVLEVLNPLEGSFDPDAPLVLNGIGSLAGTAIRHAQLFTLMQAAHKRFRELFEDSIDPILVSTRNGLIVEVNRQVELTSGLDGESLRNLSIGSLHNLDWNSLGYEFEKLQGGETISYESVLHAAEGSEIPIQVHVRLIQIEDVPYIQWILRDITERKNLDALRDDLTSMIYHDLRSPLANVVSSLDVIGTMLPEDSEPTMRSLVNIALRSTERVQRLTNSLLDINRLEAGQSLGKRALASPVSMINDALDAVISAAQNKGIALEHPLSDPLPPVPVDSDMIRRVLINLLENAIKFTPAGGKITVGGSLDGDCVRLWVNDTGPGIPPAEKERIFQKFTRLTKSDGPRGLGLGLAYCRLAVLAHGGRIWVESEPGHGSTFLFVLPISGESQAEVNTG